MCFSIFSFITGIGPSTTRSENATPSGARSSNSARCSFVKILRRGRSPPTASQTAALSPPTAFSDPEQTKPPGMASTSTPKLGDTRSSAGSSLGTTGRSLMTVSAPRPCTRRARATTPALSSARSGVSKKKTCRIWASSGSMPSARTAERWLDSGTVSLSSTLSAPSIRASISVRRSSRSGRTGVARAMPCLLVR